MVFCYSVRLFWYSFRLFSYSVRLFSYSVKLFCDSVRLFHHSVGSFCKFDWGYFCGCCILFFLLFILVYLFPHLWHKSEKNSIPWRESLVGIERNIRIVLAVQEWHSRWIICFIPHSDVTSYSFTFHVNTWAKCNEEFKLKYSANKRMIQCPSYVINCNESSLMSSCYFYWCFLKIFIPRHSLIIPYSWNALLKLYSINDV